MVRVFPNASSMSLAAAELFARLAKEAVDMRGRFSVALAGGSTPRQTYELLAAPPLRDLVPWESVHIFWSDERCVGHDDPRSNENMAREALLNHVPIWPEQIHPARCAGMPRQAALAYEGLLKAFFGPEEPRLDLVMLGLGEDAHVASLFPGSPVIDPAARWVAEVQMPDLDYFRFTMTAELINEARVVLFLVSAAQKAEVLHRVLEGPPDPLLVPAQRINPTSGDLYYYVDKPAAALLTQSSTEAPAHPGGPKTKSLRKAG